MITYTTDIGDISMEKLNGFFVGWANPLTSEQHFNHLNKCAHFVAALDNGIVVGFISAISDGIGCAFISLIEVLPEYQNQGIGSELMLKMLEMLQNMRAIDLICDENVVGFYERFGMMKLTGMGIRRII